MFIIKDHRTGITYEAEDSFDLEKMLHSLFDDMVNTAEDEEWDPEDAAMLGIVKPSTLQDMIDTITLNVGNPHATYFGDVEDALNITVYFYEEDPEPEEKRVTLAELTASCHAAAALDSTARGQSAPERGGEAHGI